MSKSGCISTPTINPESLALSASKFTSAIDAWIPATFGPKKTESDRARDFERALKAAALDGESERLGVGHPSIGQPRSKTSLGVLSNKLAKVGKAKATNDRLSSVQPNGHDNASAQDESDEDAGESRSRSVTSRKGKSTAAPDLFSRKKRNLSNSTKPPHLARQTQIIQSTPSLKSLGPASSDPLLLKSPIPDIPPLVSSIDEPRTPPTAAASSPGGSGSFPFTGPVALDSPQARRVLDEKLATKRLRDEPDEVDGSNSPSISADPSGDMTPTQNSRSGEEGPSRGGRLTKTQRRREKRKKARSVHESPTT